MKDVLMIWKQNKPFYSSMRQRYLAAIIRKIHKRVYVKQLKYIFVVAEINVM